MPRAPRFVLVVLTLAACLAHEEDAVAPAIEPTPDPSDDRDRPAAASPRPEPAPSDGPVGAASVDGPAPDPDDRDGPIRPTNAGRPPAGASLPADGELAREALALAAEDDGEKMRAKWLLLVRDHPTSPYVPLAYATFGDHYFSQGDFDAASKLYEKVLQFPGSPVRAWALYKLAWCNLQRGDGAGALDRFVQALRAIEDDEAGNQADAETLAAATRRDLVRAYALVGKPDKAAAFFQRLGTGVAADEVPPAKMLELLGRRLTKDGRSAEAATICDALKATDPRATCAF